MIQNLLANAPVAMRKAKQLAFDVAFEDIDEQLVSDTSERIAAIRVSTEGQEGLSAFFDKRAPAWQQTSAADSAEKNKG